MGIFEKIKYRPITPLLIVCGLTLMGMISLSRLTLDFMPDSSHPVLTVETRYPGVDPEKIEEIITKPLEEVISTSGGIEKIFSTSEEGKSRIYLEFKREANPDVKSMEVRARMDLIRGAFPREVQEPVILKYDPESRPVLIMTMSGTGDNLEAIREMAENEIKKSLEGISGISEIQVAGGRQREILIQLDRQLLHSRGLSTSDVLASVQQHHVNATVGEVSRDGGRFSLYVKGKFKSIGDIRQLKLFSNKGRSVSLKDMATVDFVYREPESASRVNGEDRVTIYVQKSANANLFALSREVNKKIGQWQKSGLQFQLIYDRVDLIQSGFLSILKKSLLGLIFVFLTIFAIFKSFAKALLTVSVMVISFFITAFLFYLCGIQFNLLSVSGMLISCGFSLLSSVFLLQLPEEKKDGKIHQKLFFQLLCGILLAFAIFLPFVFADQKIKIFFLNLALAMLFFSILSLLLNFSPFLIFIDHVKNVPRQKIPNRDKFLSRLSAAGIIINFLTNKNLFPKEKGTGLAFAVMRYLKHKPGLFMFLNITCVLSLIFLFIYSPKELSPPMEEKVIFASIEFPSGTGFGLTDKITREIELRLTRISGIDEVTSKIEPAHATLNIKVKESRSITESYLRELEKYFSDIPEVTVYFYKGADTGTLGEVTVNVLGEDLAELDRITRRLAKQSWKIQGISNVVLRYKSPRPEIRILIDREKSQRAELSSLMIGQYLRNRINGGVAAKFIEDNRELDIRLRLAKEDRSSLEQLFTYQLKNRNGGFVPLIEMATMENSLAMVKIFRLNKKRMLSYSMRLKDNADYAGIVNGLKSFFAHPLPENYRAELSQDMANLLQQEKNFLFFVIIALFLIYMILASFYESWLFPFFLILPIIFPVMAILIFINIFQMALTLPVYAGIILIFGLLASKVLVFQDYLSGLGMNFSGRQGEKKCNKILSSLFRKSWSSSVILLAFYLPGLFMGSSVDQFLAGISLTVCLGIFASIFTTPQLSMLAFIYFPVLKKKLLAQLPPANGWDHV